jgi:hypothetical protein
MSLPIENTNIYSDEGKKYLRVPIAKKGQWYHEGYGIISFSHNDFENIISNFNNKVLGHSPYLTYGHLDEEHNSTDSARKRGDFIELSIDGDTLYGICEAKDETYESVKNEEYEFCSVEVIRNFKDKESGYNLGTVLLRTALTNSPFLPELDKVEALSQLNTDYNPQTFSMATRVVNQEDKTMGEINKDNISQQEPSETKASIGMEAKQKESESENTQSLNNEETPKESIDRTTEDKASIEGDKSPEVEVKSETVVESKDNNEGNVSPETSKEPNKPKEVREETINKETTKQEDIKSEVINQDTKETQQDSKEDKAEVQKATEDELPSSNETKIDTTSETEGDSMPEDNYQLPDIGPGELDINKIVKTLESRIESKFEHQLKEQQSLNQSLLQQLKEAKEEVEKERTTARSHQLSLSKAQQQVLEEHNRILSDYLTGAGVSPVIIQRFSQVKDAILGKQQVVKMSQGGKTQDLPVTQALAELIVDAAQSETIKFSQQGVSNRAQYDPTGIRGSIEEVIRRNREAATNRVHN